MVDQSFESMGQEETLDLPVRKRQRLDSPLDVLHRLCVSTSAEEFSSPSPSPSFVPRRSCPICRRSIRRSARDSFQCDFCPLISHLDCWKSSARSTNELWICPNHHSPLLDRISAKRNVGERVRIAQQRPSDEPMRFRQDFSPSNATRTISEIPSAIQHAYSSVEPFEQRETKTNVDLGQFRFSHAALIHLDSERVIYLRKRVVWFGNGAADIDLQRFPSSNLNNERCAAISERHACLYYDKKANRFELLNYSEFGTIVDGLRYGFDEDPLDSTCICQENERKAWHGAASIDQGTRIQIGCHRFLFYRSVQR